MVSRAVKSSSGWSSRSMRQATLARSASSKRRVRAWLEPLEERLLLATSLAPATPGASHPALVVGRTLSVYDVPAVQNHELTITYTVYNEQASQLTGVLLASTLQPGVTFQSASQLPDRNGQELAWSLGTIDPFGRASVTLSVSLADPIPTTLDTGAAAFASMDARVVSDTTAPATLRADAIPAELLASTSDANTGDPFIQEKAAELDYDPQAIFEFVRDGIGYESYVGSLRGARGTLWSAAGNALDQASLLIALDRASGIPARYVSGTLADDRAQTLIVSMFGPRFRLEGSIPAGTELADPAHDSSLLAEARQHYWIQSDSGNGFQDADPSFAGAQLGETFTTAGGSFTEVPDALRHKVEVKLNAEITSSAAQLFGLSGQQLTTVLDHTFSVVDLVGRPLSIGHFVSTTVIPTPIFTSITHSYSPYLDVGDVPFDDLSRDTLIRGTDYQEVLTNFPFGTQVLTGLFLNIELSGPDGPTESFDRTIIDRIGFAARQGRAGAHVSFDPSGPRAINNQDIVTVNVLPSFFEPGAATRASAAARAYLARFNDLVAKNGANAAADPATESLARQAMIAVERDRLTSFAVLSDTLLKGLSSTTFTRAYFARPRITIVSSRVEQSAGTPGGATVLMQMDLRRDDIRVLAAPGQPSKAPVALRVAWGLTENAAEQKILEPPSGTNNPPLLGDNTAAIFARAKAAGIEIITIQPHEQAVLGTLRISNEARIRISEAMESGKVVALPRQAVDVNGRPRIAWYELDPNTGETIGVTEDGGHNGLVPYSAQQAFTRSLIAGLTVVPIVALGGPLGLAPAAIVPLGIIAAGTLEGGLIVGLGGIVGILIPFILGAIAKTAGLDPEVPTGFLDVNGPARELSHAEQEKKVSADLAIGSVSGTVQLSSASVSNQLTASWTTSAISGLSIQMLNAVNASVKDESGVGLGTGTVTLASPVPLPAAAAGDINYTLTGNGRLSFYASATSDLGVSADWNNYTAALSGTFTLRISTDALILNGTRLPSGTYTISSGSATLGGAGRTTSPNFVGEAQLQTTDGDLELGPGTGSVQLAASTLPMDQGLTLGGFSGSLTVTAGSTTDSLTLTGQAARALRVSASPSNVATDQNAAKEIDLVVQTSVADTYMLSVEAPTGWKTAIDENGKVTIIPSPGLQGGVFPVHLIARSKSDHEFVAEADAIVTLGPTLPGIAVSVQPHTVLTVPFQGAELPTAFLVEIHNLGPTAGTFDITFPALPPGFGSFASADRVTIPAGETGQVGIYLRPSGQLPPPGTDASFSVRVTSTTDPSITETVDHSFTVPEIHGVTLTADPSTAATTPGAAVSTQLTLKAVGNVPETVTLTASAGAGLTPGTLPGPITLAVGESKTVALTLTPDADTPLGATLAATVTASFGPASATQTASAPVTVTVHSEATVSIGHAAAAATGADNPQLAAVLAALADTLEQLEIHPTDAPLCARVRVELADAQSLLAATPPVAAFAARLQALSDHAASCDVAGLAPLVGPLFTDLADVLDAAAALDIALDPTHLDLAPGQASDLAVRLENHGDTPLPLTLAVGDLPTGVAAQLDASDLTLAPHEVRSVALHLTQSLTTSRIFAFAVSAQAAKVREAAASLVSVRVNQLADVLALTANPDSVRAGEPVALRARLLNSANIVRDATLHAELLDESGTVLRSLADISLRLNPATEPLDVDLPALDTTGLASGLYALRAVLRGPDSNSLGRAAVAPLFIGIAVGATVSASPTLLPPGDSSVTSSIDVTGTVTPGTPVDGDLTALLPGVTANSSSSFDGRFPVGRAIDGDLNTSWFTRPPDAVSRGQSPFYEILLPADATVRELQMFGNREFADGFDFLAGNFQLFDSADHLLFDSGVFDLAAPDRDITVPVPNVALVRRVRFTPTADQNDHNGFAELKVFGSAVAPAHAAELYFTQYAGSDRVLKVPFSFDGTRFGIGKTTVLTRNIGADGIIFAPDGDLLVGGGGQIHKINPETGDRQTLNTPSACDHVMLHPSGTKAYCAGVPGGLVEFSLAPFGNPVFRPLQGDDSAVTTIAFDNAGNAYYTAGGVNCCGPVGLIDLTTFTTVRKLNFAQAAHGMAFDPYSEDLILFGDNHVQQIDTDTMTIVSDLDLATVASGFNLDQGTVDGDGHIYVADAGSGRLLFIDYTASKMVGDPTNFVAAPFIVPNIDDVAPLSGLGAQGTLIGVLHRLPAAGYPVDPASIAPAPLHATSSEVEWSGQVREGLTRHFQLTGQVTGMAPGESRAISQGTRVTARLRSTAPPLPVDLSAWSVVQLPIAQQPAANWVISDDHRQATQTVNADPSVLLSDFDLTTDRIDGTWRVNTGSDDDFIGFVFGYQDSGHYYLFDWKQTDQTDNGLFAERGMSVKVVSAEAPFQESDFWPSAGSPGRVQTLFHNTVPYQDLTDYHFTLEFIPGQFTITVSQGSTVLEHVTIEDDHYTSGKFGFYNFSQEQVVYSGFTRAPIPVVNVELPPLVVAATHIVGLEPGRETVGRGGTASYTVSLKNPLPSDETYTLTAVGLDGLPVTLVSSILVGANTTLTTPLEIAVPPGSPEETRSFGVAVSTSGGGIDAAQGELVITGQAAVPLDARAVDLALDPTHAAVGHGGAAATYTLTVTNAGDVTDTYTLSGNFPAGISTRFTPDTITVAPGLDNARQLTLTLTPDAAAAAQDYAFSITARSAADQAVSDTAAGSLTVRAAGVRVALDPASGSPGGTFQLTVTNTGASEDTFDLALAGPAALAASLAIPSVRLAPQASQVVPVRVAAIAFAIPGTLDLAAIATAHSDSAVRDQAAAHVTIDAVNGLEASIDPPLKNVRLPGTASFLITPKNTGNTEDAYSATITGSTGPVSASLRGLDGAPTQTIDLFRLPGLTAAALVLDTTLGTLGDGTVTIEIRSLNHPELHSTLTATVHGITATPAIALKRFGTTASLDRLKLVYVVSGDNSPPFQFGFFASDDPRFDAGDTERGPRFNVSDPALLAVGKHKLTIDGAPYADALADIDAVPFFLAVADPAHAVPETDTSDNDASFLGLFHNAPATLSADAHPLVVRGRDDRDRYANDDPNDRVEIARAGSDLVITSTLTRLPVALAMGSVSDVRALLGGGNDLVSADPTLTFPFALHGGRGADSLSAAAAPDRLFGEGGPDLLDGQAGDDRLEGGDGPDTLSGRGGDDSLDGGSGNDVLRGGGGADRIEGNDGDDELRGGGGDNTMLGGAGNDRLLSKFGGDVYFGGDGNDTLVGRAGSDTLFGGPGRDLLIGREGNDLLCGGTGGDSLQGLFDDDTLAGGLGADSIDGGSGSDTARSDALDTLLNTESNISDPLDTLCTQLADNILAQLM